jgi:hypothetical protein
LRQEELGGGPGMSVYANYLGAMATKIRDGTPFDVMKINQPDDLGDIANFVATAKVAVSAYVPSLTQP